MTAIRKNVFKALLVLACVALPGADIECEDGEFEFNWPKINVYDGYDGWGYGGFVYVDDCCWW